MNLDRAVILAMRSGAAVAALSAIFLIDSVIVTFDRRPWTITERFTRGVAEDFAVGASKRECFERAQRAQLDHAISRLTTLQDEPAATHAEHHHEQEIRTENLDRVSNSNRWHNGLTDSNAWLILDFDEDQLQSIEKKD